MNISYREGGVELNLLHTAQSKPTPPSLEEGQNMALPWTAELQAAFQKAYKGGKDIIRGKNLTQYVTSYLFDFGGCSFPSIYRISFRMGLHLRGIQEKSEKFRIVIAVMVIEVVCSILAISLSGVVISLVLVIYPYMQGIHRTQKGKKAGGKIA